MTRLPLELRELIETGALAHLSTIDPDGSPQVTVIWLGLDGDQLVSGHLTQQEGAEHRTGPPGGPVLYRHPPEPNLLQPYAVLHAHAAVDPSDEAWDLLSRLASVYLPSSTEFPEARRPGYVVRYTVERIGGIGPWVQNA
jgi:hypothetical protein